MASSHDEDGRAALRVALVGWGAIARTVAGHLVDDPVDIVAVATRDASADRPDLPPGAASIDDVAELAGHDPDLVVEAAGRDAVAPWGRAALGAGADVVVSSVSALADAALLDELRDAARRNAARVHVSPGALAGIDALAAARTMGIDVVEHRIVKPPRAWAGTGAEQLCALDHLEAPTAFFRADAAETASRFPRNANAAMTTALAGIGAEATIVTLVADPTSATNRHEIAASGAFGRLDITVANHPLAANPKTSALAALSLVRAIRNRTTPIAV